MSALSNTLRDRTFVSAMIANVNVSGVTSSDRRDGVDATTMARNWGIGLHAAKETLKVTTHRGVQTMVHLSLSRRFWTNDRQIRYRCFGIDCFTNTFIAKTESRQKNRYAQVFCTTQGWTRAFLMKLKSEAHHALSLLYSREGAPDIMVMDNAREQFKGDFRKKNHAVITNVKQTEPHLQWTNTAEGDICELKKAHGCDMVREQSLEVLWDHCLEWQAHIRSLTAHDIFGLNIKVPETMVSGETADISPYAEYHWYEWVMFWDTSVSFQEDYMVLGRDLGTSIDSGLVMARKILKVNRQVVVRSTVRSLTADDTMNSVQTKKLQDFDETLREALVEPLTEEDLASDPDYKTPDLESYDDADDGKMPLDQDIDRVDADTHDQYVGDQVELPIGDKMQTGKVMGLKQGLYGEAKGAANTNPIIDTRTYDIEFPNGEITKYSANFIAENMFAQCDMRAKQFVLMAAFVDHNKGGHAVEIANGFVQKGSNRHKQVMTKGWQLCVEWKDGSTT